MSDLPAAFKLADEQPPHGIGYEWTTIDHVFIKRMWIKKAGIYVPQHAHVYAHGTFVATGAVRLWRDGELAGDFRYTMIEIPADVKHLFLALEDDTNVFCIHNTMRKEIVEILEEHDLLAGEV